MNQGQLTEFDNNVGIVHRYTGENNNAVARHVVACHNGTNVQLVKTVAGEQHTVLIDATVTYSAGASLAVQSDVSAFRVYYNNALIDSDDTIGDHVWGKHESGAI